MYESILATASGDPDFNFTMTTVPFPLLSVLQSRRTEGNEVVFNFMLACGISLIPCAMISFILKEREENMKHMQMISGMSLKAYWVSNLIADVIKVYIPLLLIIGLQQLFNMQLHGVWVLYMILPWAIVPFTYCMSFMFSTDTGGQIGTLLLNLFICCIVGNIVYVLQLVPETFVYGDKLRWIMCIFPTYCVINGLWWSSGGDKILEARQANVDKYP